MGIAPEDPSLEFAGCARKTFDKRIMFETLVFLVYRPMFVAMEFHGTRGAKGAYKVNTSHRVDVNIFKSQHRCATAHNGGEPAWLG
jgi:hypothetical protein